MCGVEYRSIERFVQTGIPYDISIQEHILWYSQLYIKFFWILAFCSWYSRIRPFSLCNNIILKTASCSSTKLLPVSISQNCISFRFFYVKFERSYFSLSTCFLYFTFIDYCFSFFLPILFFGCSPSLKSHTFSSKFFLFAVFSQSDILSKLLKQIFCILFFHIQHYCSKLCFHT
jgi:hypothetical protein